MTRSGLSDDDPLDVGIEQRADRGQRPHLGRIVVVAADGHHLRPAPMANSISVSAGTSEMMRVAALRRGDRRHEGTASTTTDAARHDCHGGLDRRASRLRAAVTLMLFLTSSHRKNGPPIIAVTMPDRHLDRRHDRARDQVAQHQERRAEQRRGRQHDAVVGADQQPHQVRHDDADEADRPGQRDRGAGGQRRAEERHALRPRHVHAAGRGHVARRASAG